MITHIHPDVDGGIADYVNICRRYQLDSTDIRLNPCNQNQYQFKGDVLLHMSGYGYQKKGCPIWLVKKIEKERPLIRSLGVFFHELYAFGPPWKSAFWLCYPQQLIVRRLARLSDYWITNRHDSAEWIKKHSAERPHAVAPVFSNVGEMVLLEANREKSAVIFGGQHLRKEIYEAMGQKILDWANQSEITIHDIGPPISDSRIKQVLMQKNIIVHGRLDADIVSKILARAAYGLVYYRRHELEKSGVFAAYAAHGVCPIVISPSGALPRAKNEFLPDVVDNLQDQAARSLAAASLVGAKAHRWYLGHSSEVHAKIFENLMLAAKNKP